jgi:hypothetical protein
MDWPDRLDNEDMTLFVKECQLSGMSIEIIDLDNDGRMRVLGKTPLSDTYLAESILGTVNFWDADNSLLRRYWYDAEKECWTWARRAWA